jgi:hypothetical protein
MFSLNSLRKKKEVEQLENVVLSVNRDTLISTFFIDNNIDYELLMKKLLLPYFKMKRRIVGYNKIFQIGEIEFRISGVSPVDRGVIISKTYIHCNSWFSSKTNIIRALLITTKKYENLDQDVLNRQILSLNKDIVLMKNEVIRIKEYEFYVKNCQPESGIISSETLLSIENKDVNNVSNLKIAILKVKYFKIE